MMRSVVSNLASVSRRRSLGNIWIWDSLVQPKPQTVKLKTRREGCISWYACGPTVYDSAHIGHATSYIRLDIIRRILEHQNYSVHQIMGITDIDDKIIKRANKLGVSWESLSRKYETEFVKELKDLNVKPPLIRARVSNFIPQIINFIEKLVSIGIAYPTEDGSVYFDTKSYGKDGKFTPDSNYSENQDNDEEITSPTTATTTTSNRSKSLQQDMTKKNKKDFALWKGSKPNEPYWITPWGKGRPGWHIECSVIASLYFGDCLDIHSGGCDLIFPHHENEETQCCAYFGIDKWVTHWIHTGHLIMKNDMKMSKSLGNTFTISEFLKHNSPNVLRMFCLTHNTRTHLQYTEEDIQIAKANLSKYENFVKECQVICQGIKPVTLSIESAENLWNKLGIIQEEIDILLCNDFDFSTTTKLVKDFISDFHQSFHYNSNKNKSTCSSDPINFELVLASQKFVQDYFNLMGFQMDSQQVSVAENNDSSIQTQSLIEEFVDFRQKVRSYSLAMNEIDKTKRKQLIQERESIVKACDDVRNKLHDLGIEITDHGKNSSWHIKSKSEQ